MWTVEHLISNPNLGKIKEAFKTLKRESELILPVEAGIAADIGAVIGGGIGAAAD